MTIEGEKFTDMAADELQPEGPTLVKPNDSE
jgi:hypothetical protein